MRVGSKTRKTQLDGEGSNPSNAYSIEVLTRAINVLSVFGHARPQLSLSEIVAAVRRTEERLNAASQPM